MNTHYAPGGHDRWKPLRQLAMCYACKPWAKESAANRCKYVRGIIRRDVVLGVMSVLGGKGRWGGVVSDRCTVFGLVAAAASRLFPWQRQSRPRRLKPLQADNFEKSDKPTRLESLF